MTGFLGLSIIFTLVFIGWVAASPTTTFHMIINPASLAVSIVDNSYQSIDNPIVELNSVLFSNRCQSSRGVFGTNKQEIYIKNPSAALQGWNVTLSAENPWVTWEGGTYRMDFNDPTDDGCLDGDDKDDIAGSMIIDPSRAHISVGQCRSCISNDIILGNLARFQEGSIDTVTLVSGTPNSDDLWDWILTGIEISQTIPANQPASWDYHLPLLLSVTAQ